MNPQAESTEKTEFDPSWLLSAPGVRGSLERPVVDEEDLRVNDEEERAAQSSTRESVQSALT